MQTYPSYRDSGVKWLGNIPQNWKVKKIKYISNIYTGNSISDEKKDQYESEIDAYPYISTKDISLDNNQADYENGMYTPIEDLSFRVARKDNILICIEGGSAGKKMTYLLQDVTFVNKLCCIQTYNFVSKFAFYYLQTKNFEDEFKLNLSGLIGGVNQSELKNFYILAPSIQEQEIIARYLDVKTEQIDTLISKLQTQAEMLEAYKRELIAEVVTKGLNKKASLKDSGVDWIGNVPEHWDIVPLMAVAKENKTKNEGMKCNNLLSLSYGNIIRKDIDTNFGLLPESFEGYQVVHEGYMILRMTDLQNDKRSLRTGYATETGIITSAYIGLEPSEIINSRYFSYLLHAYDLIKVYYSLGAGLRQSLRFNDVKRLPVLLPSKEEQKEIVSFLDEKTGKIHEVVSDITNQIEKLKDYRKILIHEAVTGKIKITEG